MKKVFKRAASLLIAMTMVVSTALVQTTASDTSDSEFAWSSFRGNNENNGVTNSKTPQNADDAQLYWATNVGEDWLMGSPIIVGDYIYFCSGDELYKLNRFTGEPSVTKGSLAGSSAYSIIPPTYADGKIFVALSGGIVQALDADTLESLWIYHDPLQGQANTPVTYHNGCVYTGFYNHDWSGAAMQANFVCIDAADEDTSDKTEEKSAKWTYKQNDGFYWAGAYVSDNFLLVGTENGIGSGSDLLSLDPSTGEVIDKLTNLNDAVRSSVVYDKTSDRYYFTSKGGSLYSIAVNADGTIKDDVQNIDIGGSSTSTPVINDGRAYVGVVGENQYGSYSGHHIAVIDLENQMVAYTAKTKGYPQTSGLLSKGDDGYAYVYFIENDMPGCVRVIKDKSGVNSLIDGVKENSDTGYAPVLFTPSGEHAQYAICSPVADEYGTLYIKNDSTHMMAVGSKIKSIEVAENPDKTVYQQGDKFNAQGIKVIAKLSNGLTRDITKYIKISDKALDIDDKEVTITYDIVKYGDKFDAENGNTAGVESAPLETYVDVNVLEDEDYQKIKAVEEKIDALGDITLESENSIIEARTALNSLDESLRQYVNNTDKLIEAEKELELLKRESESSEIDSSSVADSSSSDSSSITDSSSVADSSSSDSSESDNDTGDNNNNSTSANNNTTGESTVNTGVKIGSAALVILLLACGLALAIVVVKTTKGKDK